MQKNQLSNVIWRISFLFLLPILLASGSNAQTEQQVIDKYLSGDTQITTQLQKDIITRYNEQNVVRVHTFPRVTGNSLVPFFTEDFTGTSGTTPPANWQNVVNTGGNPVQPWEFRDTAAATPPNPHPEGGGFSGMYAILDSDEYGSGNTQNASLITPAINCTGRDFIYISFSEQFRSISTSSGTLSVSTDGGTVWTDLFTRVGSDVGYPNPAVQTSVLVPQATNQADVRFRFTYVGTFGWWWAIDNVMLEEGSALVPLVGGNIYPINGTQNPPTSFENISSAVSYLNINGVTGSGQVILELASGYTGTEPAPVNIGAITGTSSTLGITFRPAAGYTATTEVVGGASPNQHAIALAGPSYITLDGRSGGTGTQRNWTIKVTGSGTSGLGQMAVRLQNNSASMTDINIRNIIMIGEAANVTGAVFQITGVTGNTFQNIMLEENLITSTATTSTDTRGYGITVATASNIGNTGLIVRNNEITNFYARGMNITAAFPQAQYYGNRIYHTTAITQPGTVTEFSGIYYSSSSVNGVGTEIHSNMVYGIQLTNHPVTTTTGVNGIYMFSTPTSGVPVRVYNNMISIGQNLTGTAADANVYGIRENTTATGLLDIYYNSVYVGGEAVTGVNNSAAFRKQLSNNLNLSNNVFFNARSNNGATGVHWGIMTNNVSFASISNNDYFTNGAGGVLGTTTGTAAGNQATLADWLLAMGGLDVGSISQNPNYLAPLTTPPNLKIDTAIPTQLESGGISIAGITTDFEGDTRNATTPDMGADEFTGVPLDLTPPTITYTSLLNTNSTANRTISANIVDPSGVQAGANGPRIYFKKNFDGTYLFDASPTVSGDDFTFVIDHSVLSLVVGDTVYYYFAAQDSLGNAGTNPVGGSGSNPPGTTPPATADFYFIIPPALTGDYTVGTLLFKAMSGKDLSFEERVRTVEIVEYVNESYLYPNGWEPNNSPDVSIDGSFKLDDNQRQLGDIEFRRTIEQIYYVPIINGQEYDGPLFYEFTPEQIQQNNLNSRGVYATITAAVADVTLRGVSGPVRFLLEDASYPSETFPIVIGSIIGTSSTNTITILPNTGVTTTVTASIAQPVFDLDAASYIVFDGRPNGLGTTNSLTISNTSTAANATCIRLINGSGNNIVRYVNLVSMPSSSTTRAFELSTSLNNPAGNSDNLVEFCDINSGRYGVYFNGTTANPNNNNIFRNNKVYESTFSMFYMINSSSNTTIEGNEIYNLTGQTTANSAISLNINGTGGVNNIIGNKIYDIQNTSTTTVRGITGTPAAGSTLNIINNFISLTNDNGTKTSLYAIQISGTTEHIANIYNNTMRIGGVHTGGSAGTIVSGGLIKSNTGATSTFNAKNNVSINNRSAGTSGVVHTNFFIGGTGIVGTLDINYNVYFADGGTGAFHSGWNGFVYNDQQAYRDSAAPYEQNSIFYNVNFVSNTDLHVSGASIGDTTLSGLPIAGITTDIDGQTRDLVRPYRGADEGDTPLPVELSSFSAAVSGNGIKLIWSTNSENNNRGFEVERQIDEIWQSAGFVDGNGTTTSASQYSYVDNFDFRSVKGTVSYRLKQIDFDGSYHYSNIVNVEVDFTPKEFSLYQNYPNPFNPSTRIKYAIPVNSNVKVIVYNLLGEVVSELVNSVQETGYYDVVWNANNMASGLYFYTIQAKSTDGTKDFTSVKKMMLVK